MNKVEVKNKDKKVVYREGDIFKDVEYSEYYILARPSSAKSYCAISLSEGSRWDCPSCDIESATAGLTFVGRDKNITID